MPPKSHLSFLQILGLPGLGLEIKFILLYLYIKVLILEVVILSLHIRFNLRQVFVIEKRERTKMQTAARVLKQLGFKKEGAQF